MVQKSKLYKKAELEKLHFHPMPGSLSHLSPKVTIFISFWFILPVPFILISHIKDSIL